MKKPKKYQWDDFLKFARFDPDKILPIISRHGKPIEILGKRVSRSSFKLYCFKRKGLVCAKCNLEGKEFHLEYNTYENMWVLNLYGFKGDRPILFTHDHIIPKSKGGLPKTISNIQTMCYPCNHKKGDSLDV